MKKVFYIIIFFIIIALFASLPAFAHSGGTDSKGGHYNHSTGKYHYHHGYSAHQHEDGICPYDTDEDTTDSTHWWTPFLVILGMVLIFASPYILSKTLQIAAGAIIYIIGFMKRRLQSQAFRTGLITIVVLSGLVICCIAIESGSSYTVQTSQSFSTMPNLDFEITWDEDLFIGIDDRYVLNTHTKKIHLSSCRVSWRTCDDYKDYITDEYTIENALDDGYTYCSGCFD